MFRIKSRLGLRIKKKSGFLCALRFISEQMLHSFFIFRIQPQFVDDAEEVSIVSITKHGIG